MLNRILAAVGLDGLTEKQTFMAIGALWAAALVGLLVIAWKDKSLWEDSTKKDKDDKPLKRAEPKPRPATPRRRIATSDMWKLGIYELTVVVASFIVLGLSFSQIHSALTRDYAVDRAEYEMKLGAWRENPLPSDKPGAPGAFILDLSAGSVILVIGFAIFLVGAIPLYRNYQTVAYGREVTGTSQGTASDWTRSIVIIPANSITIAYRPEGAEVDEEFLWKGMPGESWFTNAYPEGSTLTVYYDEANPSQAVAPALLGLTPIPLAEPEKKDQ